MNAIEGSYANKAFYKNARKRGDEVLKKLMPCIESKYENQFHKIHAFNLQ